MVTKWKNKSRKICEKRGGCVLVWAAIFISTILFFAGLGVMAGDVKELREVPEFFRKIKYVDSKMHKEDVIEAFAEVREKAVPEGKAESSWRFKGMYDLIIQHEDYFFLHETNIPDEEYEEYQSKKSRELADGYFKKNMGCYYIWDDGEFVAEGNVELEPELNLTEDGLSIAVGFTPAQMEQGQQLLDRIHRHVVTGTIIMAAGVLLTLFFFFTLVLGKGKASVRCLDTDVSVVIFVSGVSTLLYFIRRLLEWHVDKNMAGYVIPKAMILGTMSVLMVCAAYILVCNFRAGVDREGFLFIRLGRVIRAKITGECYYSEGIQECCKKRQRFTFCLLMLPLVAAGGGIGLYTLGGFTIYSIGIEFLSNAMLVMIALTVPYLIAAGVVIRLYQKGTEQIVQGEFARLMAQVDELSEGNYQSGRLLEDGSVFTKESLKISMLGCQMQENVQRKIEAEKMKIDLITNVSHDLKTPLTSIISYIDLLSKEELSPAAKDYVQVLEKKSKRLGKMIADVFDLSKASSGNLKIRKEKLDFNKLLIQILADMEQEIKEAQVKIVREISDKTGMIKSDGEKLYRVLQNILDNALKYSMPETRIYVILKVENRRVSVCVKNVSAYEMNFTRKEVLGRFFRGDKARSTEGSGLGLAIAKEFTEVCGGTLDLRIDGDVFIVEVEFPCCDVIVDEKKKKKTK